MSGPTIRAAEVGDLTGLLELYRHLHPADLPPGPTDAEAAWSALLGSGIATVLVAEVGGILASSCMIAIMPNLTRRARPFGVIENVVTHADYRRAGLGRSVLLAALELAWTADCYKVMLATGSSKPETLRFYAAAGFTQGEKTYFEARRP
jgi:GNAT superfamily N-acetyltransferase